jgi:hypothetical protein
LPPEQAELCFHSGFLLGLFFDPEDGGDMASNIVLLYFIVKNALYFCYKQITKGELIAGKVQSCRSSCTVCILGHRLKL